MVTKDRLLKILDTPFTNRVVSRLHNLMFVPSEVLEELAKIALKEEWGKDLYALEKYLAVQIAWSIEQEQFTMSSNQWYLTAGNLQTRYGTPIYLVVEKNSYDGARQPWYLRLASSQVSAPSLPSAPKLPDNPIIPKDIEIVMMHDHILGENGDRVKFLKNAPPVAQMCAISGAIQWSLNRNLQLPYWYYGKMQYVVPLYLKSRENITEQPDLVAPIQINQDNLLVRTVLAPHMPYANARVSVKRHDQLPPWLIDSWKEYSKEMEKEDIENPEKESESQ